jgi:hypothetical protein
MSDLRRMQRDDAAARRWLGEVSGAALAFEQRWTAAALKRVDPDLSRRLHEQRGLFDRSLITGTADEIETQGSAMCRGYAAAVRALEGAGEPDDAYVIGKCPRTGFTVAIGSQKAAADRVREVHGERVVWVTPDEVASLLNSVEAFKPIAAIKRLFPGAEIVDRYADEPAQDDSYGDEAA